MAVPRLRDLHQPTPSKQAQATQWLDEALDALPIKIKCGQCGETVGRYQPGRVQVPSVSRPAVNFKCVRPGCRTETVVILGETIL